MKAESTAATQPPAPAKKHRGIVRHVVAIAVSAVVVVAAALAPAVLFRLEDTVLFDTAQPREQLGGDLSDGSYLAWVFLARANADSLPGISTQNDMDGYEVADNIYNRMQQMVDVGALNPELPQALMERFYWGGPDLESNNTLDNYGFESLDCVGYGNADELLYANSSVVTEKRTGKVVRLWVYHDHADMEWLYEQMAADRVMMMDNYLAWLGLGRLEDWVENPDFGPTEEGEYWQVSHYRYNAKLGIAAYMNIGRGYFGLHLEQYFG